MNVECNASDAFDKMCLSNEKECFFFACGRRKNGTERWRAKIKESQWKEGNRQNRIRWMDGMQ